MMCKAAEWQRDDVRCCQYDWWPSLGTAALNQNQPSLRALMPPCMLRFVSGFADYGRKRAALLGQLLVRKWGPTVT